MEIPSFPYTGFVRPDLRTVAHLTPVLVRIAIYLHTISVAIFALLSPSNTPSIFRLIPTTAILIGRCFWPIESWQVLHVRDYSIFFRLFQIFILLWGLVIQCFSSRIYAARTTASRLFQVVFVSLIAASTIVVLNTDILSGQFNGFRYPPDSFKSLEKKEVIENFNGRYVFQQQAKTILEKLEKIGGKYHDRSDRPSLKEITFLPKIVEWLIIFSATSGCVLGLIDGPQRRLRSWSIVLILGLVFYLIFCSEVLAAMSKQDLWACIWPAADASNCFKLDSGGWALEAVTIASVIPGAFGVVRALRTTSFLLRYPLFRAFTTTEASISVVFYTTLGILCLTLHMFGKKPAAFPDDSHILWGNEILVYSNYVPLLSTTISLVMQVIMLLWALSSQALTEVKGIEHSSDTSALTRGLVPPDSHRLIKDSESRSHQVGRSLARAYTRSGNYDDAMVIWWTLVEARWTDVSVWMGFRETCELKRRIVLNTTSRISMTRFLWLSFFSILSRKLTKSRNEEINWWPFANKDELMILRPFVKRQEWHCEYTGVCGYDWIHENYVHAAQGTSNDINRSEIDIEGRGFSGTSQQSNVSEIYSDPQNQPPAPHSSPTGPIQIDSDSGDVSSGDTTKHLPMFTSCSKRLFHGEIEVQNHHIDDDREVFRKLAVAYQNAQARQGRLAHIFRYRRLVGIKHVEVKVHGTSENHYIEIMRVPQDRLQDVSPGLWVFYLQNRKTLKPGTIKYRGKLPLRKDQVEIAGDAIECSTLLFEHELNGGIYAFTGIAINLLGIFLGLLWSFLWKDPQTGFTVAAIAGLPMNLLALLVILWKI